MKRFLPVALLLVFAIAVVWILNSGDKKEPQVDTTKTTVAVEEMEEATLEGGMERTNTVVEEEEAFDPRGLKVGGGKYGLQTMCEGGGQANVTILERI